ncbi:MAG: hypothetical protein LQ343_000681 [Gyalolechia ehrenbergii]|nr:MAG: hypothetical protein LQ343_000681 [Gyalolechia ehrenbergii]
MSQTNATAPRRPRRPKTPEVDQDEDSDVAEDSGSEVEGQTLADRLTSYLAVAKARVAAAVKYHNSQSEGGGVKAFARISGQNWTYYVQELAIAVGRPPDAASRHSSSLGAESSPVPRNDPDEIHIDLGPSKTVSRFHAQIFFDRDDSQWYVQVKGRNGLRVNDRDLRRGQKSVLGCGDVLEIAGTQMVFIAAGKKINIHPTFLERMAMYEDEEAARTNKDSHTHPDTTHVIASSSSQTRPSAAAVSLSQANALAPAPPNFARPTTPVRSPKRPQQSSSSAFKNSAGYAGAYSAYRMETTEQIDYSNDAMKDLKPSIPYAVMITQAILSKENETITLNDIYEWIMANFAYYRHLKTNWQNSIRHNLSLNAAFEKVPRGPNEPGKGMKWHIVNEKRNEMIAGVAKHMKKSNARHSSVPNSPSTVRDDFAPNSYAPTAPAQPYSSESNAESNAVIKTSPPPGRSPPLTAYPSARESYTPSRGSRLTTFANNDHSHGLPAGLPALSDDPSPLPIRRNNIKAGVTDSSPILTSGFYDGPMMTPAPRKHNLNVPLPNTIKLPTSHMPDSSPAPFWKFEVFGSTPAKLPEMSPLKVGNLQSSSPPPGATNGNNGMESPTRGRGQKLGTTMGSSQEVDDDDGVPIDLTRYVFPFQNVRRTVVV